MKSVFMKYFTYLIIIIVAAAIIAGFFILGTPQEERLRKLDDRRIGDLQTIQWQVIDYWQNKNKLPEKLADLIDPTRGVVVPVDPETGAEYEYLVKAELEFTLCATFSLENSSSPILDNVARPMTYEKAIPIGSDNWQHAAGRACFERAIDPDFYKKPMM